MERYDPRNPIIKATDDEGDEVQGHSVRDIEQPDERILRATEGGDAEVAGHSQDGPDERILRATEEPDDEDEV